MKFDGDLVMRHQIAAPVHTGNAGVYRFSLEDKHSKPSL